MRRFSTPSPGTNIRSAGRARSDDAGFVVRLYAAGALLVLDAEQAGGCSGRREEVINLRIGPLQLIS
jgi:hypothetical protein